MLCVPLNEMTRMMVVQQLGGDKFCMGKSSRGMIFRDTAVLKFWRQTCLDIK